MSKTEKTIIGIATAANHEFFTRLILKSFEDKRVLEFCTPVVFASSELFDMQKKKSNSSTPYSVISDFKELKTGKLNVLNVSVEKTEVEESNQFTDKYLNNSLEALSNNQIDGLITFPFNVKKATEHSTTSINEIDYLFDKFSKNGLKVFLNDEVKIAFANKNDSNEFNEQSLLTDNQILQRMLKQECSVSKPKIAILKTVDQNKTSEDQIVKSFVAKIQSQSQLLYGPFDTKEFFESKKHQLFDATVVVDENAETLINKILGEPNVWYLAGLDAVIGLPSFELFSEKQDHENEQVSYFHDAFFSVLAFIKERKAFKELTKNPLKFDSRKLRHIDA